MNTPGSISEPILIVSKFSLGHAQVLIHGLDCSTCAILLITRCAFEALHALLFFKLYFSVHARLFLALPTLLSTISPAWFNHSPKSVLCLGSHLAILHLVLVPKTQYMSLPFFPLIPVFQNSPFLLNLGVATLGKLSLRVSPSPVWPFGSKFPPCRLLSSEGFICLCCGGCFPCSSTCARLCLGLDPRTGFRSEARNVGGTRVPPGCQLNC